MRSFWLNSPTVTINWLVKVAPPVVDSAGVRAGPKNGHLFDSFDSMQWFKRGVFFCRFVDGETAQGTAGGDSARRHSGGGAGRPSAEFGRDTAWADFSTRRRSGLRGAGVVRYDGLIPWMMRVQGRQSAMTRHDGAALAPRLKTAPRRRYSPCGTGGAPAEKLLRPDCCLDYYIVGTGRAQHWVEFADLNYKLAG